MRIFFFLPIALKPSGLVVFTRQFCSLIPSPWQFFFLLDCRPSGHGIFAQLVARNSFFFSPPSIFLLFSFLIQIPTSFLIHPPSPLFIPVHNHRLSFSPSWLPGLDGKVVFSSIAHRPRGHVISTHLYSSIPHKFSQLTYQVDMASSLVCLKHINTYSLPSFDSTDQVGTNLHPLST